jgi:hypothetical protein
MSKEQNRTEVSTIQAKSLRSILEVMRVFQAKHPDKCMVVDQRTQKWVRLKEVSANYD